MARRAGPDKRLYHIEFRSTVESPRPIPMGETGYRSHFIYGKQLDTSSDLPACVDAVARALARGISLPASSAESAGSDDQLSLFD